MRIKSSQVRAPQKAVSGRNSIPDSKPKDESQLSSNPERYATGRDAAVAFGISTATVLSAAVAISGAIASTFVAADIHAAGETAEALCIGIGGLGAIGVGVVGATKGWNAYDKHMSSLEF